VHGTYGCCDAQGVLHYCLDGVTVQSEMCTGIYSCGWDSFNDQYDCNILLESPSSSHPIDCGSM
jgi:hypothetical protein